MSNKYVILNFKRFGDVFQSAHLVSSIKKAHPQSEIHYVCFTETLSSVNIINHVDKVHTVQRKKITTYLNNPIYSDGLAFNALENDLSGLELNEKDHVINYSNDMISSYITSFLTHESGANYHGIRFSHLNTVEYSCDNAIILNDILTSYSPSPYTLNDAYHRLLSLKEDGLSNKIITSRVHDESAERNLQRLRCTKNLNPEKVKIVGIQICSSNSLKDMSLNTITELVSLINEHPDLVPMLMVAPTPEEKERADIINTHFDNTLVSVESDFKALPSVLNNIDLLITPDTSVKHLADALNVKTLEVSLGFSPFLKQGTINPSSLIMTFEPSTRIFKESSLIESSTLTKNNELSGSLIYTKACQMLNTSPGTEETTSSSDQVCYKAVNNSDGRYLLPVDGNINNTFELRRVLTRSLLKSMISENDDSSFLIRISKAFEKSELKSFSENEKNNLSQVTKELLSTLRALVATQEKTQDAAFFIDTLEQLLSHCHSSSISAVPLLFFRAKIETIQSQSLSENLKEVESNLYQLKKNIQLAFSLLQALDRSTSERVESSTRREATI
jgi:ADP-heptose:LPS heptosyltransferase